MSIAGVFQQIRCTAWAHVRRRPLRYGLSLVSVAMAVALFASMRISQASLIGTFESNLKALAGGAEYVVTADNGVETAVLERLEAIAGVSAAPVLRGPAILRMPVGDGMTEQVVTLFGIDPVRDHKLRHYEFDQRVTLDLPTILRGADVAIVPQQMADSFGMKAGSAITLVRSGRSYSLTVGGFLKPNGPAEAMGGHIVFATTSVVQRVLGRTASFDRIDVALSPPATLETVRAAAGSQCRVQSAQQQDSTFLYLYSQFQSIFACIAVIAAIIGLFIVYNSMSLSVVERSREIGTLRALGARRSEILAAVTSEAALLGLVAALLGAVIGRFVADVALAHVSQSINLIMNIGALRRVIPLDAWLLAPVVGIVSAVLGALVPARAAALMPPVATMKAGELDRAVQLRTKSWLVAAIPLMAGCLVLVRHPKTNWGLTLVGVAMGLCAFALAGPQLVQGPGPWLRSLGRRVFDVPAYLALDNLIKFPTRTSLTTVAFGGSLALVVAVAGTIGALDRTIGDWLDDAFVFDVCVQTNDLRSSAYSVGTLPGELLHQLRSDPEVDRAYGVRTRLVDFDGDEIMLVAFDLATYDQVRVERGFRSAAAIGRVTPADFHAGRISVSDNFSHIHGVRKGDRIRLRTPVGERSFEVASIQPDYSWFRGAILMDLAAYQNLWSDTSVSYIDIRVKPNVDPSRLRDDLSRRLAGAYTAFVYTTGEIKSHARSYLREWFALANVQLLLAIVIGGVGVANTLLISTLTQTRQIGLLRAIGATAAQIRRMLLVEAGFLGIAGGLCGCVIGMLTVRLLVMPMAMKASGFELPWWTPWGTMGWAMAAAMVIAVGSSVLPLRAVRRLNVVQAIGYE